MTRPGDLGRDRDDRAAGPLGRRLDPERRGRPARVDRVNERGELRAGDAGRRLDDERQCNPCAIASAARDIASARRRRGPRPTAGAANGTRASTVACAAASACTAAAGARSGSSTTRSKNASASTGRRRAVMKGGGAVVALRWHRRRDRRGPRADDQRAQRQRRAGQGLRAADLSPARFIRRSRRRGNNCRCRSRRCAGNRRTGGCAGRRPRDRRAPPGRPGSRCRPRRRRSRCARACRPASRSGNRRRSGSRRRRRRARSQCGPRAQSVSRTQATQDPVVVSQTLPPPQPARPRGRSRRTGGASDRRSASARRNRRRSRTRRRRPSRDRRRCRRGRRRPSSRRRSGRWRRSQRGVEPAHASSLWQGVAARDVGGGINRAAAAPRRVSAAGPAPAAVPVDGAGVAAGVAADRVVLVGDGSRRSRRSSRPRIRESTKPLAVSRSRNMLSPPSKSPKTNPVLICARDGGIWREAALATFRIDPSSTRILTAASYVVLRSDRERAAVGSQRQPLPRQQLRLGRRDRTSARRSPRATRRRAATGTRHRRRAPRASRSTSRSASPAQDPGTF